MKIRKARANHRKKALEIETARGSYHLPFSRLGLKPGAKDRLKTVRVDPELGSEGVTYVLESGREGSVHLDAFLDYHRDPDFLREATLHKLTVDAVKLVNKSGLSKHELIRRLKTSPSQLYRLLDPANSRKSVDEMLRLLAVLGCRVELLVVERVA